MDRYSRQLLLSEVGDRGQEILAQARVAVVGLGALGSSSSECIVRAGVGNVILIDRDILEISNLQRQFLYDEEDVRERLPKAVAARNRLSEINSSVHLTGRTENLHAGNIMSLLEGVHVIIDGTDNIETRYLINDYSVKNGIPWVYGGAIGTSGTGLFVLPREGPCLRCAFPTPPDTRKLGTCDTVGVLGTVPVMVGAWQASMVIRYLVGARAGLGGKLLMMDLWEHGFLEPEVMRKKDCPACVKGEFPYLQSRRRTTVVNLCGTEAFQVTPSQKKDLDLTVISGRLDSLGEVDLGLYYLRFKEGGAEMILYPGGRAQISGVVSDKEALSFYTRYVGL